MGLESPASATVTLAMELIGRASITPADQGCQALLAQRLAASGFKEEHLPFGEVDNLWARRGTEPPLLTFLGHTDVVPTGPVDQWVCAPFSPTVREGYLYGRGAADMKGSIAAFVTAVERFVARSPRHRGSIALALTSDEEGPAVDGIIKLVAALQKRHESIDWCLVGEPSSHERLGDVVRCGRRGSLGAKLTVFGRQGHVAYPACVDNPIHRVAPVLEKLSTTNWDTGNAHFPPTSFQVSNINAGTGATNVVPGTLEAWFNLRYCTEQTGHGLKAQIEKILEPLEPHYEIEWFHSGEPFLTSQGALVEAVVGSIQTHQGLDPELSTGGGTSDGRFVAPTGAEVVELGPVNATIHQVNERVGLEELEELSHLYEDILHRLLG